MSRSALLRSAVRPPRTAHARSRGGFTLIEMVSVIPLIGLLLMLSAGVLQRTYEVHQTALDRFRELEQLRFWSDRLREDVHQASSAEASAELQLTYSDGSQVAYRMDGRSLVRSRQGAALRPAESPMLTEQRWNVDEIDSVEWDVDRSGRLPLVRCQIGLRAEDQPIREFVWLARLGASATAEQLELE